MVQQPVHNSSGESPDKFYITLGWVPNTSRTKYRLQVTTKHTSQLLNSAVYCSRFTLFGTIHFTEKNTTTQDNNVTRKHPHNQWSAACKLWRSSLWDKNALYGLPQHKNRNTDLDNTSHQPPHIKRNVTFSAVDLCPSEYLQQRQPHEARLFSHVCSSQ